jgi:hypothetical protein
MGRAIDTEKDIDALKLKVKKLEDTVRGMVSKLDELDNAVFDYEEETVKEETKEKTDGKEKANNKGSGSNSKRGDAKNGNNKKKNDRDGDNSK